MFNALIKTAMVLLALGSSHLFAGDNSTVLAPELEAGIDVGEPSFSLGNHAPLEACQVWLNFSIETADLDGERKVDVWVDRSSDGLELSEEELDAIARQMKHGYSTPREGRELDGVSIDELDLITDYPGARKPWAGRIRGSYVYESKECLNKIRE